MALSDLALKYSNGWQPKTFTAQELVERESSQQTSSFPESSPRGRPCW